MVVLIAFAFVSGLITILSPCILPVLPIVLSGGVAGGRARPLGIVAGFVLSFAFFTLALTGIVQATGISPDALRIAAFVIVIAFGLVLLVPQLQALFERLVARLPGLVAGGARGRSAGFAGGLAVGGSLGLVWTPCVGPIMASVVSLALTQRVDGGAVALTLAYALGTAVPMLAVMAGGRALVARVPALARSSATIQRAFGALMIVVGVAIGAGWDRRFQAWVLQAVPGYGAGLTALETGEPVRKALERRGAPATGAGMQAQQVRLDPPPAAGQLRDYGEAPPLVTRGRWFNTAGVVAGRSSPQGDGVPPLAMSDLRGKVVIVDFWTYSCINCVRTIPYLKAWWEAYRDKGLVIVGVHTPEFEFEKSAANLQAAMTDLGVAWPVVQDNDFAQWNAYANRYWPAKYFIDATGRIRYSHFGEGEYEESERVIRALLREAGTLAADGGGTAAAGVEAASIASAANAASPAGDITPETYLGYARASGFASASGAVHDRPFEYRSEGPPRAGEWSLRGLWTVGSEHVATDTGGTLELGFRGRRVYLVVEPVEGGGRIQVRLDGRAGADTPDVRAGVLLPGESRLYELVSLPRTGEHTLTLEVKGRMRLFAFTFG